MSTTNLGQGKAKRLLSKGGARFPPATGASLKQGRPHSKDNDVLASESFLGLSYLILKLISLSSHIALLTRRHGRWFLSATHF